MGHDEKGSGSEAGTEAGAAGMSRRNMLKRSSVALAALGLGAAGLGKAAVAQAGGSATLHGRGDGEKPTIVLCHGAFADGNSWAAVIEKLQDDGYSVFAPAVGIMSVAADIASVRKFVTNLGGPVLLVGHSYGGIVITGAGSGPANVKGLVYIAAYAPTTGDTTLGLNSTFDAAYGPSELGHALRPDGPLEDPSTLLYIDPAQFRDVFVQDVSKDTAAVMAATQRPAAAAGFVEPFSETPAWSLHPAWYLISSQDRVIQPGGQRWMAERAGAQISELRASHASLVSEPSAVARLIKRAAKAVL